MLKNKNNYSKHLTQIIYKKFEFLFYSHFVDNARRNFGYDCAFRLMKEKNNSQILLIHNLVQVLI